jgi:hypothetical protein
MVQQLTVMKHSCKHFCKRSSFLPNTCFNLRTLLIIANVSISRTEPERWCEDKVRCPILENARPRKIVILYHNFKLPRYGYRQWPTYYHKLLISCPTLTLVMDETGFGDPPQLNAKPVLSWLVYSGVTWKSIQELRILLCGTPTWDDRVPRKSVSPPVNMDHEQLAIDIIVPLLRPSAVPVTIYLFRLHVQTGDDLVKLQEIVDEYLDVQHQGDLYRHQWYPAGRSQPKKPVYTLKTLNEYIEEGVEDELLEEELQYWREENNRRLNKGKIEPVQDEGDQVLH